MYCAAAETFLVGRCQRLRRGLVAFMLRTMRQVTLWAAVLLAILAFTSAGAAQPAALLRDFGRAGLQICAAEERCHDFDVYVATTPDQWRQGLMYIRSMPRDQGMLFDYPIARELTMWMKNTFLPLDMLFVTADNEIVHIYRDAEPQSTRTISSVKAVTRVIELNAGTVAELNISVGDRIVFPAPGATAQDKEDAPGAAPAVALPTSPP